MFFMEISVNIQNEDLKKQIIRLSIWTAQTETDVIEHLLRLGLKAYWEQRGLKPIEGVER